jgi:putative endonuclease
MNVRRSVEKHYYVYTLLSLKDNNLYTGYSSNLKERLYQHYHGEVQSTCNRRPLKLIHYEYFINEKDARAHEIFLKSGFGRNNFKKALQKTLLELTNKLDSTIF